MQQPYIPGPSDPQQYQARMDADQLKILGTLMTVYGVLAMFGTCFGGIYLVMGIQIATNPKFFGPGSEAPPQAFGTMFAFMGAAFVIGALVIGGLSLYAAKCLRERRNWTWVVVSAGVNCIQMPIGTALGVFTLVVLMRPSVRALFDVNAENLAR